MQLLGPDTVLNRRGGGRRELTGFGQIPVPAKLSAVGREQNLAVGGLTDVMAVAVGGPSHTVVQYLLRTTINFNYALSL